MIRNNENKKISRIRKRRVERRITIDDEMESLLNELKTEKKNKKNLDKIKELEIELFKIKNAKNPIRLQSELKELNKIHVIHRNLHEIKNELLGDYVGEFEMVGRIKIADQTRRTHIRFRNIDELESYVNAIDQDYESEEAIFNCYIYKINTPQVTLNNRSQYGIGCDFKHENIEYPGSNCFIPTKVILLLNVLISQLVTITNNNVLILSEMKTDDQI